MSKKQQVEKVQKCNAVISAFQAGVRDRQAGTKQEGELEEKESPAGPSASPEEKSSEEAKPEEADKTSSLLSSQQTSAPTRDECRVNQEAWSRLRDGKGVEPEDLDKSHQLTPPAFVRPKRQADDDQPVEVEQDKKEQVGRIHDLQPIRLVTQTQNEPIITNKTYLLTTMTDKAEEPFHKTSQKKGIFTEMPTKKEQPSAVFVPAEVTQSKEKV